MADVVVVGGGPAGLAIAGQCARRGLRVIQLEQSPRAEWRAHYGVWADELPDLPASAIAAVVDPVTAHTGTRHTLTGRYLLLHNPGLRAWLDDDRIDRRQGTAGTVVGAEHGPHGSTVALRSGERIAAGVVVDASGAARVLSGGPPRARAYQTAYGLALPADSVPDAMVGTLMDWRGEGRTFGYLMPLGDGRVLVEETALAARPPLGHDALTTALRIRLDRFGVSASAIAAGTPERVRIPLDVPLPRFGGAIPIGAAVPSGAVPFGVAAGVVHPATGYSVATSIALAPAVAAALADALPTAPRAAVRAARHVVWPGRARAVHALRAHGLRALLGLSPADTVEFFDRFFALPAEARIAYTSGRADLAGTITAMAAVFQTSPVRLKRQLLG